jgi:NAD(P)-dependent dehydrogenase (short-subunit alcohol dehydrogenase family)
MDLELRGKVALVTGGSKGIGRAVALGLAAEGALVAVVARDAGALDKVAAECRDRSGQDAVAIAADLSRLEEVERVIGDTKGRLGRIDILVNNAGLGGPTPLDDPDDSRWNAILATNLTAAFRVIRETAPFMPQGGRIINMSSVLGRFGVAGQAAYSASKHGLIGLTRTLALELAPREITVNAICPGWVETEMGRDGFRRIASRAKITEEQARDKAAKMAPLGRVLDAAEVAGLAVYLAGEEAKSVTGQAIVIDGGQVMP